MVRSGFSSMLGELAMSMMLLTGNYVFIRELGEDGVAAFSVACYLYPIVFMINNAVAESAQPIISFNHGAGNRYRVKRAFRVSLSTATICGVFLCHEYCHHRLLSSHRAEHSRHAVYAVPRSDIPRSGIYPDAYVHLPTRHVARRSRHRMHDAGSDTVDK